MSRSRQLRFAAVVACHLALYAMSMLVGLSLEDRYPAGLAILPFADEVGWPRLLLYFVGLYALRFPLGTLLSFFEGTVFRSLEVYSALPNALLLAFLIDHWLQRRAARTMRRRSPSADAGNTHESRPKP